MSRNLFISTAFYLLAFASPASADRLLFDDPFYMHMEVEYERPEMFEDSTNIVNYYISPSFAFKSGGDDYALSLNFWIAHQILSEPNTEFLDTFFQVSRMKMFELGGLPFNWHQRIFFPTSRQSRLNSFMFSWRSYVDTKIPTSNPDFSFYLNYRIELYAFEYAAKNTTNDPYRYTAAELKDRFLSGGLNNLFANRLQFGVKYQISEIITLSADASMYINRTYEPGAAESAAGLQGDWYMVPYLTESLTVGLTPEVSFIVSFWHTGLIGAQRKDDVNPWTAEGTKLLVRLAVDV